MNRDNSNVNTTAEEQEPLLKHADGDLLYDQPPKIESSASLSSLVDMKVEKLANIPEVIMNTFKSFVGSGILGLPYGFSKGGWLLAIISFPLASFIAGYCLLELIDCKTIVGNNKIHTYSDCGRVAFGKPGYYFIQISLILYQLGCCCSYMLIVTQNLELLTTPYIKQEGWVGIMIGVFFIMSFIRSLKLTAIFSFLANILLLSALTILLIGIQITGIKGNDKPILASLNGFASFFGIVLFAFEGAGLVLPIHNSMAKKQYYSHSLVFVLILVCCLNLLFGLLNYLKLTNNTPELITTAIPTSLPWLRTIISIFIVITITVSFHLQIFPVFEALDLLKPLRKLKRKKKWIYWITVYSIRLIVIGLCGIPSVTDLRTHFPSFVGLIGATLGSLLSFIVPPLLHIKICWKLSTKEAIIRRIGDIITLIIMIPASIYITVVTIIDLVKLIKGE